MVLLTALYAVAIFLSGFLLFLVEPMAGKRLLPLLGGSAAVWTTCLVFFQCALLLGYLYAHRLAARLRPAVQRLAHVILLLAGLLVFAVGSRMTVHASTSHPIWTVFSLLGTLIGLPFLALSGTGPLLQSWYSMSFAVDGRKAIPPYHLFALSNLGSLLALVAYPALLEPYLSLHTQHTIWIIGFAVLASACMAIAWQGRKVSESAIDEIETNTVTTVESVVVADSAGVSETPPSVAGKLLWLMLAGCGSLLLCAVTGYLSQNIAAIPLLWILPLIVYLLSFVLVFQQRSFYPRLALLWLLPIALAWAGYFLAEIDANPGIKKAIFLFCALLLIGCLFCHGELHRLRPPARYVTSFYLYIAAGGALGALFVGVAAPILFSANYEFVYGLVMVAALAAVTTWRLRHEPAAGRPSYVHVVTGTVLGVLCAGVAAHLFALGRHKTALGLAVALAAGLGLLWWLRSSLARWGLFAFAAGAALLVGIRAHVLFAGSFNLVRGLLLVAAIAAFVVWWRGWALRVFWLAGTAGMIAVVFFRAQGYAKDNLVQVRSFYGVLRVTQTHDEDWIERTLYNGTIEHGNQIFNDDMRKVPTTYYAQDSGVGLALRFCCGDRPRRVGVIGLGTGTIATYGRSGDVFRFYDINPQVERIARSDFSYLRESAASIHVILGDARISLAQEPSQQFDVLAIDAFSGDAVPVHLLTAQAMTLYARHMRPGGIIAFHISNRYLDLAPVLQQQADHAGLGIVDVASDGDDDQDEYEAEWVLLTSDQKFLSLPEVNKNAVEITMPRHGLRLWTDDYNSLLPLVK